MSISWVWVGGQAGVVAFCCFLAARNFYKGQRYANDAHDAARRPRHHEHHGSALVVFTSWGPMSGPPGPSTFCSTCLRRKRARMLNGKPAGVCKHVQALIAESWECKARAADSETDNKPSKPVNMIDQKLQKELA